MDGDYAGTVELNVESAANGCDYLIAAEVGGVGGIDYADGVGVGIEGAANGGPEDSLSSSSGIAVDQCQSLLCCKVGAMGDWGKGRTKMDGRIQQ